MGGDGAPATAEHGPMASLPGGAVGERLELAAYYAGSRDNYGRGAELRKSVTTTSGA